MRQDIISGGPQYDIYPSTEFKNVWEIIGGSQFNATLYWYSVTFQKEMLYIIYFETQKFISNYLDNCLSQWRKNYLLLPSSSFSIIRLILSYDSKLKVFVFLLDKTKIMTSPWVLRNCDQHFSYL